MFNFAPWTVKYCGFSLVTNVLIVSCFGQKCLLNALNINGNVKKDQRFRFFLWTNGLQIFQKSVASLTWMSVIVLSISIKVMCPAQHSHSAHECYAWFTVRFEFCSVWALHLIWPKIHCFLLVLVLRTLLWPGFTPGLSDRSVVMGEFSSSPFTWCSPGVNPWYFTIFYSYAAFGLICKYHINFQFCRQHIALCSAGQHRRIFYY